MRRLGGTIRSHQPKQDIATRFNGGEARLPGESPAGVSVRWVCEVEKSLACVEKGQHCHLT